MTLRNKISAVGPHRSSSVRSDNETEFILFSEAAEAVELCLFDPAGERELERIPMQREADLWSSTVSGVSAGQRYGYRVHGPYDPSLGLRFNSNKLLIDPYARALDRSFRLCEVHFGYSLEDPFRPDPRDSAPYTPKSVLTPDCTGRTGEPARPLRELVIYELHVKGMTMRREDLPAQIRGTFAGLASESVVEHLTKLGVTAVELLPVQPIADERRLTQAGLRNYWGYNSINFFALEPRYAAGEPIPEFSHLIDCLHDARIEVILDVVFNHTGEGDEWGPTICFRGIDNAAYYRLNASDKSRYVNDAGTGNTLNIAHPRICTMVLDSLRYWARLGVDGFRFDLATVLGKANADFDPNAAFFRALNSDPELAGIKLIAEPWDATADGYRLGSFRPPFSEWNDKFRDTARRFWRGDRGMAADMATRLSGSSDYFPERGPLASINFITAHDGFTLQDLVSYADKHNALNGEQNTDGNTENYSANNGIEGETSEPAILEIRDRLKRNLIATLMLSLGVPMLTAGDELSRSQTGNNNPYCQDNEISWLDWKLGPAKERFLRFFVRVIALRAEHPCFRRHHFYSGVAAAENGDKDITWVAADGAEMTSAQWQNDENGVLACTIADGNRRYLVALNSGKHSIGIALPVKRESAWKLLLDTSDPEGGAVIERVTDSWYVEPQSVVVLLRQ